MTEEINATTPTIRNRIASSLPGQSRLPAGALRRSVRSRNDLATGRGGRIKDPIAEHEVGQCWNFIFTRFAPAVGQPHLGNCDWVEGKISVADVASLSDAVWASDLLGVDAAIRAGVDVNSAVYPHQPPLHLAIEHMKVEIARRLIAAGAEVNRDLGGGWTPLVHAIDIESDTALQAGLSPDQVSTDLTELLLASGAVPTDRAIELARNYSNHKALGLMDHEGLE